MKDEHTYGNKMARYGLTKVIYKGTLVSIQSLLLRVSFDGMKERMGGSVARFRPRTLVYKQTCPSPYDFQSQALSVHPVESVFM